MYLNIILTILVIVMITISIGTYIWWKNYGKKLFGLIDNLKKINSPGFGNHNDITNNFKSIMNMVSNMKNKRN
jgi:hypothetical protein